MPAAESVPIDPEVRRRVMAAEVMGRRGTVAHFTLEQRQYYGKASSKKALATRLARHGPTGQVKRGYDQWRAERGLAPVPDSRPAKLNEQAIDYQI